MELFIEVMSDVNLYDLGWKGDKYTWSNSHIDATFTKERLDSAVANPKWMNIYTEAWVEVMVARTSNYKPLIVHLNMQCQDIASQFRQKKRFFKYEASWALEEDYEVVLKEAWRRTGS